LAALGYLFGDLEKIDQILNVEKIILVAALKCLPDPSPLVRRELACVLSRVVQEEESKFIYIAHELLEEDRKSKIVPGMTGEDKRGALNTASLNLNDPYLEIRRGSIQQSLHSLTWKAMLALSVDPFHDVAVFASFTVDKIHERLTASPLVDLGFSQWMQNRKAAQKALTVSFFPENIITARKVSKKVSTSVSSGIFGMSLENTPSLSIRRSSSFVFSLRNLVGLGSGTSIPSSPLVQLPAGSTQGETQALPEGNRTFKRRPQSMFLSGSNNGSPSRLRNSPSEPLLSPTIPAKPSLTEPTIATASLFYDWSCEYFMEPQMKVYLFPL
jgi:regulator-associated protein of mTOR